MWERFKRAFITKGIAMVDRPAYKSGWKDGYNVGKREGYEKSIEELKTLSADQIYSIYTQHVSQSRRKPREIINE